jgi:hypothetical protein
MGRLGSEQQLPPEEQQCFFDEPDVAQSTRPAHADYVVLGLLPAPELPEEIAEELSTELPELLSERRRPCVLGRVGRL